MPCIYLSQAANEMLVMYQANAGTLNLNFLTAILQM